MKTLAIDFETFYTTQYSLRTTIAEEYCRDERFDAYLISCWDGADGWVGHPRDFNWASLEDAIILAHNKYFDYTVWLELARRGLAPEPRFREFHCTANLTSWYCNCRALDQAVAHVFKTHISKQARTDMKDKHWSDLTAEQQEVMRTYALDDVKWCWQLWEKLSPGWPQFERELSNLTIEQGMCGIQIDTGALDRHLVVSRRALEATKKTLPWTEEGKAPSSSQAVAYHCRKIGIPGPPAKVDDAEGFEEWEAKYSPDHAWIQSVSNYRSLAKLVSTFEAVKSRLRDDDTMPFALKYFGAHTGRWAGDAKINLQNPRKESVLINEQGLMESDPARIKAALKSEGGLPEWVAGELNFRHLLVPRPGKRMIISDLSQIEPRVLAWLAGDKAFLELVGQGISPYEAFARTAYGWTGGKLQDEDPKQYALMKAQVLGLGYGCGWKKFITVAKVMAGLDLTEDESKKIVNDYRSRNKLIVDFWYRLDDAFKQSYNEDFVMTLPSGRKLTYRMVRRESRTVPDPENPEKMIGKWVWTADTGGRREATYGGKLTENITQSIARDVFAGHLLALNHTPGVTVLFSCHDEAVVEVDGGVTADDVQKIMSVTPEWLAGCPIAAKAKEVKHYCKG